MMLTMPEQVPHSIRNYRPDDFDALVGLYGEAERLEPAGRAVSPQLVAANLGRPGYDPKQDLFLLFVAGRPAGWLEVSPELGIGRVVLWAWLHPDWRGRGLAGEMLQRAMRRAAAMGARVAQINIHEDSRLQEVLEHAGFALVRRFYEYELETAAIDRAAAFAALRACRYLRPGEEAALTDIQNRSFAGTWGYDPNSLDTIAYRTHLPHFSYEDVIIAETDGEIAGYCWTEVDPAKGGREGRICMIGVSPEHREHGLGRRLLLAGLERLAEQGVGTIVLTVDSENQAACALYWSVGFTLRNGSLWYEKLVG
jgi:mycothiol synthase